MDKNPGQTFTAQAFDSLATFYRKGYVRWVGATKRRPEVRAARIARDGPVVGRWPNLTPP